MISTGLVIVVPFFAGRGVVSETQKAPYGARAGKPDALPCRLSASHAARLREAGIPTVPYPDTAAQMFNYLWRYTDNLRGLYETPTVSDGEQYRCRW